MIPKNSTKDETENLRISAMFWTYPNGRDRDPQYIVCWGNPDGTETQEIVSEREYRRLQEAAGEPTYTEHGYASYTPIWKA